MPEKSSPVKILNYHIKRTREFVGENKPFPSMSQLASKAVDDLCSKLETKKE